MTKFARKSRLRKLVSTMCAVAMLASLIVVPAFAAPVDGEMAGITAYDAGTTALSQAKSFDNPGLNGVVSILTSITPATRGQQESNSIWQTGDSRLTTLSSRGLNVINDTNGLRIGLVSPAAADIAGLGALTVYEVPVTTTPAMTVAGMVDAINGAFAALDASKTVGVAGLSDDNLAKIKTRLNVVATFEGNGAIRLTKQYAEGDAEVWAFDNAPTDAVNKGVADVIFSTNDNLTNFGRGSGPAAQYVVGTPNVLGSLEASFTPTGEAAMPYLLGAAGAGEESNYGSSWGSFNDNPSGALTDELDFAVETDDVSGFYTGIRIEGDGDWDLQFKTASRSTSVQSGKATLTLGNGTRDAAYDCPALVTTAGTPTAGKTETFTVTVPDAGDVDIYPYGPGQNGYQNAINGIRVLFPKEITGSYTATATPNLALNQSVTTSATAYGPLVEVTNFFRYAGQGDMNVRFVSTMPTVAAEYGPIKVWIRNVGSDAWVPIFCEPGCLDDSSWFNVQADVLDKVTMEAESNRAGGKTLLAAKAFDKWGNEFYADMGAPIISPAGDGAGLEETSPGSNEWIWTLASTQGTNTATFTYGGKTATPVVIDTTGVGEPAKVNVIADKAAYVDGATPAFYLQLVDANGKPTSFLDYASHDEFYAHLFSFKAKSPKTTASRTNIRIYPGWSRSSNPMLAGLPSVFTVGSGDGPDTWTLAATANGGEVAPATLSKITFSAADPALVGVPHHLKVTAVKPAPAQYAVGDGVYNEKDDLADLDIEDSAFGYAKGDGSEVVTFTAQVVDYYGTPVTQGVANLDVMFSIPVFPGINGVLPTGHDYETKTNANGVATVTMKAYRPTLDTFWTGDYLPEDLDNEWTWFTPLKADLTQYSVGSDNWSEPCEDTFKFDGWGFAYFHGGEMTADIEKTLEGDDKDVVLADNVDSTTITAMVEDPAFDMPLANWPVSFSADFGTIDGAMTIDKVTAADGKAAVVAKSGTAGEASISVIDDQRTSYSFDVTYTDWKAVSEVIETNVRAGDRAVAKIRAWYENIKTGARLSWDSASSYNSSPEVYSNVNCGSCHPGAGTVAVQTNDADWQTEVDTNADGKADAVEWTIPAKDVYASPHQLESAGERYALIDGTVSGRLYTKPNIFYDEMTIVAAPARPSVNFVKEATIKAEGTQLWDTLSLVGDKFTPGRYAPGFTDEVNMYLGDFTTGDTVWLGKGWVGKDGKLLPTATTSYRISRMAPGTYDITVDGLVFKDGLTIRNLFNDAWISVDRKSARNGDEIVYLANNKTYQVNVNAFGGEIMQVWAGSLPLGAKGNGLFTLDTRRIATGRPITVTAVIRWPIDPAQANGDYLNGGDNGMVEGKSSGPVAEAGYYTTMVSQRIYVQKSLSIKSASASSSKRTLKVSGTVKGYAEASGAKNFLVKAQVQKYVKGKWVKYGGTSVRANASTGKYSASFKVKSAGKYRFKIYHSDKAHPMSYKYSKSRTIK